MTVCHSRSTKTLSTARPRPSILINGVSLLETELGHGQTPHVLVINCQPPPGQEMERRHGPRDTGAAVCPHAMAHVLALQNRAEHRDHRFHHHPRIPGATRADVPGSGITGLGLAPCLAQDAPGGGTLGQQRGKRRVVDAGAGAPSQAPITPPGCQLTPRFPPLLPR